MKKYLSPSSTLNMSRATIKTQGFSNAKTREMGVGMIEVLITLLILSIGLLGVASLQFVGSFNNKDAMFRTQAVMVAQQLSERLRVSSVISSVTDGYVVHNNYFEPDIYNFDNLSCPSDQSNYACFCSQQPADIPDCQSNQCSADDMAIFDAYQVSCSLSREIPGAEISLTCNDTDTLDADACTAGSIHSIAVTWPRQNWQNQQTESNSRCNPNGGTENDCIVLELGL